MWHLDIFLMSLKLAELHQVTQQAGKWKTRSWILYISEQAQ